MILSALNNYYWQLAAEGKVPAFGYSDEEISYALLISPDGEPLDVLDLRNNSGKKMFPRLLSVPSSFKRPGTVPRSFFLWDKTSYLFGVEEKEGAFVVNAAAHDAFKNFHRKWLMDSTDVGMRALLNFLDKWVPERFYEAPFAKEMVNAKFVFRFNDGKQEYLHQRLEALTIRSRILDEEAKNKGMCLVSGELAPLARLHPPIKGIQGTNKGETSIVSFNKDAFCSYGKEQGNNSPVSELVAASYVAALNVLLRRGEHHRQCIQIGDANVVFWAIANDIKKAQRAENLFALLADPPIDDASETERLRKVLDDIAHGKALHEIDPDLDDETHFYVLGLAPNASRLSIRYWLENRFDVFVRRFAEHYNDLLLMPSPWKSEPQVWRLLYATAPSRDGKAKADDVSPLLAGEVMRAILTGSRYPMSLLSNVIMRFRSDGEISGIRVALCKAVLTRDARLIPSTAKKEIPVSFDKTNPDPAYRLGRLFAVLEGVQRAALGKEINATIRDRYYGAASATPAAVFPLLLRNAQHHLAKVRKEKPGLAYTLDADISDIFSGMEPTFPKNMSIENQGRFAIGYYHQSQARFAGKNKAAETENTSGEEE